MDELPLTTQESLPDELPLSDAPIGEEGSAPVPLCEAPPSSPEELSLGDLVDARDAAQSSPAQEAQEQGLLGEGGAMFGCTAPGPASIFQRRGRPNLALQEALREEMERQGVQIGNEAAPKSGGRHTLAIDSGSSVVRRQPAPAMVKAMVAATTLSAEQRRCLQKRPVAGLCPLSPIGDALSAARELIAKTGTNAIDPETMDIAKKLMANDEWLMTSKKAFAADLGVDRKKLREVVPLLAAALYHDDRCKRARLEEALVVSMPQSSLLMYLDFNAYDETPLPVVTKNESGVVVARPTAQAGAEAASQGDPRAICSFGQASALSARLRNLGGPQKIVQTVHQGGVLLKFGDSTLAILSGAVCPLQVVDKCTAKALKEVQLRINPSSGSASLFGQALRVVCTDRHPSNMAAERALVRERDNWLHLHVVCEVHKTAQVYSKTFGLMESNVRGMLHCALSLRDGAAMTRFRQALRAEIESRFEVRVGTAPRDAVRWKKAIMRLFVSHGASASARQVLLALCPNGDWRSPKVQHYVAPGRIGRVDKNELLEHVTAGLTTALASTPPSVYPRHRWTGADLSTDSLGIFESCHKLLSTTYMRFIASFECRSRASRILAAAAEDSEFNFHGGSGAPAIADASAAEVARPALVGGMADQELPNETAGGATAGNEEAAWAEVNAARRRTAAEWLASRPLARLVLQRTAMEPLRQLLGRQFEVAAEEWELEQQARILEACALREKGWGDRDYKLGVAASCEDEAKFFRQLSLAFNEPTLWTAMPPQGCTIGFRALAFKVLSRMGSCVHELLLQPHTRLPLAMFRLLSDPNYADTLLALPDCQWDEWSRKLRAMHPSLRGEEFYAKLAFVAMAAWKDIAGVEARHASVRRYQTVASTQTHAETLQNLSASWCFLQARKASRRSSSSASFATPKVLRVLVGPWGKKSSHPCMSDYSECVV